MGNSDVEGNSDPHGVTAAWGMGLKDWALDFITILLWCEVRLTDKYEVDELGELSKDATFGAEA